MNKYKLSMKTPSGLGTEYIYVESKYDNFERYLKEHNLKYQKYNFKTNQDKEIERLNNTIEEYKTANEYHQNIINELETMKQPNQLHSENVRLRAENRKLNNIINELEKRYYSLDQNMEKKQG